MEQSPENFNCSQDCVNFWMNGASDSSTLSTTKDKSSVWNSLLFKYKDLCLRGLMPWRGRSDYTRGELQSLLWQRTQPTSYKPTCHHRDSFAGSGCKFCPDPNHCSVSCPLQHLQRKLHLTVVKRLTVQAVSLPVGTLFSSLALSFYPEGTDVRTVAFVVRSGSGQLQQHVAGRSSFS